MKGILPFIILPLISLASMGLAFGAGLFYISRKRRVDSRRKSILEKQIQMPAEDEKTTR